MKWRKSGEDNPLKKGDYIVKYKGGHVGKLYWWDTFWANGNVDVSYDVDSWLDETASPAQQGGEEDEMWNEVIETVESGQFLNTSYKKLTDRLKSKYTITKKL